MSNITAQRKKVVVLAAAVACLSGVTPILMRNHHRLGIVWIVAMAVALVFVIVQFGKLQRSER